MDIKGLVEVPCKSLAIMLKGKTVEELREILNVPEDLTPEEKEKMRKENESCAEK